MPKLPVARKLFVMSLILLLALLVTHCGRNPAPEAAQPAELLWVSLDVSSQVEQTLAANYQQDHPNITFNRQSLNPTQDYLAASTAPDILMSFVNHDYRQASRTNQLIDLSEVWLEASLEEDLLPNVQTFVRDRESGKPYMQPIAFAWAGIYYNKAIFDQYNLQPPQNWDEFMQICATLQVNGETPLAMAGSESYAYTLWFDYLNLRLNGADYHRALLSGEERFDDSRISLVLELWRNLFEQGYVVARPEFMNASDAINALIRGDNGLLSGEDAVMVLMDTYTLSGALPEFREELDFFPFPTIDPAIPLAESIDVIGYIIPANATHSAQAQQFLTYLATPTAHELIAREAALINAVFAPVRSDLDASAFTTGAAEAIAMLEASEDVVPFTYQSMPPVLWTEFNRAYRQLLANKQDIQSFMDSMKARVKTP